MDWIALGTFFGAALFETLHPGPTIALVIDTRARSGSMKALRTVAGVTIANLAWICIALFVIYYDASWLRDVASFVVGLFAVPILLYLASERILESTAGWVANVESVEVKASTQDRSFRTGFVAHFLNPLSFVFYLATFGVLVAGKPLDQGIIYGAVPVTVDLIIFAFLAAVPLPIPKNAFPRGLPRLVSGLCLFFIVVHVSAGPSGGQFFRDRTGLVILAALFLAAIQVARQLVRARREKTSKALWRVVALWDSWFKIAAIVGTILTLASAFVAWPKTDERFRICAVVAGVLASTLAFARAFGELQDERFPSPTGAAPSSLPSKCWQASEIWAGIATFGFLGAVFLLMTLTGFSLHHTAP